MRFRLPRIRRLSADEPAAASALVINVHIGPNSSPIQTGREIQRALDAYYRAGGRPPTQPP